MIILSNIQKDKLERLGKLLLIQHLNEKPLVFVRFEDIPDNSFCIINGKYLVTREAAISYFFSNFFRIASSSKLVDRLYKESREVCEKLSIEPLPIPAETWAYSSEYFMDAWSLVLAMQDKYESKEVLGWALEKNIKVI